MRKLTKLLSVMVALIMCLSIFAFTACDEVATDSTGSGSSSDTGNDSTEDSNDTESSNTDANSSGSSNTGNTGNTMAGAAALSTLSDIYTSTTGYEFTISSALSIANETSGTQGANLSATILTKNDGTNFNADLEANISATYSGSTTYEYVSALLRGSEIYAALEETNEEGMTNTEKAAIVYSCADLSDLTESISYYAEYLTEYLDLSSYLETGESIDYDGLVTAITAIPATLLSDLSPTVSYNLLKSTMTINYDIDEILLNYVASVEETLNLIANPTEEYTLDDFLNDKTVKETLETYLDGMTGKDIYEILNYVYQTVNEYNQSASTETVAYIALAEETASESGLPVGTEEQTAYEYILQLVDDYGYGDTVLNSEMVLGYVNSALDVTDAIETAIEASTIEFALVISYNNDGFSINSISFDLHDLVVSGNDIDLDFEVTMQSKAVTLTDESKVNYNKYIIGSDVITIDETNYSNYLYTLCNYYDGTTTLNVFYGVYEYDSGEITVLTNKYISYSVAVTTDESGNITAVTLTDIETEETVTYEVTDNTITLEYDNVVQIKVPLS